MDYSVDGTPDLLFRKRLEAILDDINTRLNSAGGGGGFDGQYSSLTGVPSAFNPSAHTHTESEITDLGPYQPLAAVLTNTTASYTTAEETKLAGIEAGATADQTDGEIAAAYNNQVAVVSQAEAEAGTATTPRRWTAERIAQAIAALAPAGGGGGTTIETFSATKNGNQDLTGNAYQDVTGFDTPTYLETGSFNASTGEWTCGATGKYVVRYSLTLDQYSGNNRDSAFARLVLDGSLIKGTEKHGYHRQTAHGHNNYSAERRIPITAGQAVKLQCRNESTARLHRVNADSLVFEVERYS